MAEKLVCPICGEPTRVYMGNARRDRLCGTHADELKAGIIIKNHNGTYSRNNDWYNDEETDEEDEDFEYEDYNFDNNRNLGIEFTRQKDQKCIVCHNDAPKGSLCYDCWCEMSDFRDSFDKNANFSELSEYYYNLKSSIYRMQNIQIIQTNCNKLMALAVLARTIYNYTALSNRVINDIKDIIEKKTKIDVSKTNTAKVIENDTKKEELFRTLDGHYVKSAPESEIDNLLYEQRILHCYEQQVSCISADDPTLKADWFLPIRSIREGIYIEYWGMSTKKYLENKARKQKIYKEENIPLIEIEKDDLRDKMGLINRIIREINALAKKFYGIERFIKP